MLYATREKGLYVMCDNASPDQSLARDDLGLRCPLTEPMIL